MIVARPENIIIDDLFIKTQIPPFPHYIHLKLEGFSFTNSIKIKPALQMIESLEQEGRLTVNNTLIESSSGNLGLALSMICASKGYRFICVSDPNISPQTIGLIKAYGTELIIIDKRDANGGFLASRIALINEKLREDPSLIWLNQYANPNNPLAHYDHTARHIADVFPHPNYLFIGSGTTGTLGGVSQYFKEHSPQTHIIAVDTEGSVTFGTPAGLRRIPGLGTSTPPKISEKVLYDDLMIIKEIDTITMCRRLAKRGLLLGGSTGTVMSAVAQRLPSIAEDAVIVAISPDMGDRYIDTIYNDEWVASHF